MRNKTRKKESNPLLFLIVMSVYVLFSTIQNIVERWYLNYLILFVLWWIIFYVLIRISLKKLKEKPASLWKEFENKYPIVVQYDPPEWINPAEAWLLYNCKVDVTDLTSLIYQWTLDWLISVKNITWENSKKIEKIELIKLRDISNDRPFFERSIFEAIFLVWNQKVITYSFQLKYAILLEDLEIHGISKWRLYRPISTKIWKIMYSILVWLLIVSFFMMFRFDNFGWYINWFVVFLILLFGCIFLWWYMFWWKPLKLTDKWAKLASHIIGYRNFIKSCDENKIRLFLKDDPLFVDKTLPYATAFWIETEFINKISPMKQDFYHRSRISSRKDNNLWKIILYLLNN